MKWKYTLAKWTLAFAVGLPITEYIRHPPDITDFVAITFLVAVFLSVDFLFRCLEQLMTLKEG